MRIAVIGTGYVGLVSGVCFSEIGNHVVCVDNDSSKVELLRNGEIPIYEPGLQELAQHNVAAGKLSFTTDIGEAVRNSEMIIIAVGTPSLPNGEANLSYIEQVAKEIGSVMDEYKIVVTKSTVPVGTNYKVKEWISELTDHPFDIVSIPEFLREGTAIKDTLFPDRVVIGVDNPKVIETLVNLHKSLTDHIVITDIRSSEMIKYASNAFLATKISFINEIANICEKVGADVTKVAEGMGYDKRIGPSFLQAGIGYGGSCFPKDTEALIQIAGNVDYEFKLLKSVVEVNKDQRFNVIHKLEDALGTLNGQRIGVWGLAFKPNTDDVRDAPAIDIISTLIKKGAYVQAYDPIAVDNFRNIFDAPEIEWSKSALEAAKDCDAICLLTEWSEFAVIELVELASVMKQSIMIDGRNVYGSEEIASSPFRYYSVGRPNLSTIVDDIRETSVLH
ncbi:UDP-glucose dehydrogenase family protein [Paenibacillus crassostreae]|uniref:UDP-glucose 6-dehydrogenase n=1 Tax=Paenibacillus crassostreae TaxID=1763538 RepID=A0A162KMV7_9BACL|nr:UDP-glucose/GDP-mannose dehydrogenase family protein [Paenibacillus crassostreae]AOZ92318.1 UDP-glucose 6-dehydrogenase [Paenibacillus crassostreae]OAB71033.1 UDP-glucose 6-dehydrogenase [Paenibacillus crassostreae]